jgi:2-keto-4-pentenoate hydratase
MNASLETLARSLAEAWRACGTIPLPAAEVSARSRAEAYAVQDRMAELLGEPCVGWKVGAAVRAVQIFEGHDGPIVGRILASRLQSSPGRVPAAFAGYKIECEFAFRFARDLPPKVGGYTRAEVDPHITLHPGLELAGSRYAIGAGSRKFTTHDSIADNGGGGGYILGLAVADWRPLDLATLPIDARIDGGEPIMVYTGEYRRDPVDILVETVNGLGERGIAMAAGDILSTGSLTLPTPLQPGQTYEARFAGLPALRASMDAR